MRSLRALRGLRGLTSYALNDAVEVSARSLTTVPDLKSVLKEKIPEQQVRKRPFPYAAADEPKGLSIWNGTCNFESSLCAISLSLRAMYLKEEVAITVSVDLLRALEVGTYHLI